MEYEGNTPVKTGDKVMRYDWIIDRWHDAVVVDALATQFTVTWDRITGGDRPNVYAFDYLVYTDKGTSWKLN